MGSNDRGESKNFKILKFKTSGKTGSGKLTTFDISIHRKIIFRKLGKIKKK